jgi:hypothetical protein
MKRSCITFLIIIAQEVLSQVIVMPTAEGIFIETNTTAPVACSFNNYGNYKLIDSKVKQVLKAECFGDISKIDSYSWSCLQKNGS